MGADEYFDCIQSIRIDLLELFGSGYVIEHCISTLNIKYRNDLFKDYMAEGIKACVNNLSRVFGGVSFNLSLRELLNKPKELEDLPTEEEVIDRIQTKLRGN